MRALPPRVRGSLGLGLWGLFAIMALAGGWLFLRACGTQPGFVWAQNFCPASPDHSRMLREAEVGEGLQRQVHAAELRLAELPPCPPPPRIVPPTPPRVQPRQHAESDSMDERVKQRGGKRGRLQFTLAWATLDDLDIHVACPGGEISAYSGHRGPGICGDGVLDIDANRNLVQNVSSTPIENVAWSADIPDGTYLITIIEFLPKRRMGNIVPFRLRMRLGDEERICDDVVTTWPKPEWQRDGAKTYIGTYRTITWRSGEPLPSCTFATERTIQGAGK